VPIEFPPIRVENVTDPDIRTQHPKKYAKVRSGMAELDLWLRDLVRQGLAALPTESAPLWNAMAARMVDAQAPEIARELRSIANLSRSDALWREKLLARLGRLYLVVEGWQRFESLSAGTQADILTQIGWTQDRRELLSREGIIDRWLVLGQHIEDVAGITNLKAQRIWLWGEKIDRPALILNYAHGKTPFDFSLIPGTSFESELVFYDSAYPLRALVKTEYRQSEPLVYLPGYETIAVALQAYSAALGQNPWLEQFPLALSACIPQKRGEVAIDPKGEGLPLDPQFTQGWQLMAIGGGTPISVFGEWNGEFWLPLSAITENRFIQFSS
jgi:hypothetical protein